jgi:hypothetical protein
LSIQMTQTARSIPEPQRLRALEQANKIRLARASLKRRIALGETSAAEVILECPAEAVSWPVGELLMSQRRWGGTRCRKFLVRNQIVETKQIGRLTDRQRRVLAAGLGTPVAGDMPVSREMPVAPGIPVAEEIAVEKQYPARREMALVGA